MSVASNYYIAQPILGGLGSYTNSTLPAVTTPVPDGVNTLLFTQVLPLGCYTGTFEFIFTGDATTDINRLIALVLTPTGALVTRSQVLTNVVLPDATENFISIPINFNVTTTALTPLTFYLFADYTGTNISVPALSSTLKLTKIL